MKNNDLLVLATLLVTIWNLKVNLDILDGGQRREELLKDIKDETAVRNSNKTDV
jgi:hypothetical protein